MPKNEAITLPVLERIDMRVAESFSTRQFRPTVAALILREHDGHILLVQSAFDLDAWGFPQGGVEKDERAVQALNRELREEISLGPDAYSIVAYLGEEELQAPPGRKNLRGFTVGKRYFFFLLTCSKPEECKPQVSELESLRWVDPKQVLIELTYCRAPKREMLLRQLGKI